MTILLNLILLTRFLGFVNFPIRFLLLKLSSVSVFKPDSIGLIFKGKNQQLMKNKIFMLENQPSSKENQLIAEQLERQVG